LTLPLIQELPQRASETFSWPPPSPTIGSIMVDLILNRMIGTATRGFLIPKTAFLTLTLACLVFPMQTVSAAEALVRTAEIPLQGVEGRLDHLAFDAGSQRLFVAALENHTIEVVDLGQRRKISQITNVSEPQGLLYVPEKNRLLVCSRGDGTCRSFDATSFQEGPWVDLGRNADNVRFDSESQLVIVGSAGFPQPRVVCLPRRTPLLISCWISPARPTRNLKSSFRRILSPSNLTAFTTASL
jgi:hypothetical protein